VSRNCSGLLIGRWTKHHLSEITLPSSLPPPPSLAVVAATAAAAAAAAAAAVAFAAHFARETEE